MLLREQGERDDARALLRRAVSIFDQALGATHPDAQWCRQTLKVLEDPVPSPGDPAHGGGDTNAD